MLLQDLAQEELLPGSLGLRHGVAVRGGQALRAVVLLQAPQGGLALPHKEPELGWIDGGRGAKPAALLEGDRRGGGGGGGGGNIADAAGLHPPGFQFKARRGQIREGIAQPGVSAGVAFLAAGARRSRCSRLSLLVQFRPHHLGQGDGGAAPLRLLAPAVAVPQCGGKRIRRRAGAFDHQNVVREGVAACAVPDVCLACGAFACGGDSSIQIGLLGGGAREGGKGVERGAANHAGWKKCEPEEEVRRRWKGRDSSIGMPSRRRGHC